MFVLVVYRAFAPDQDPLSHLSDMEFYQGVGPKAKAQPRGDTQCTPVSVAARSWKVPSKLVARDVRWLLTLFGATDDPRPALMDGPLPRSIAIYDANAQTAAAPTVAVRGKIEAACKRHATLVSERPLPRGHARVLRETSCYFCDRGAIGWHDRSSQLVHICGPIVIARLPKDARDRRFLGWPRKDLERLCRFVALPDS